MWCLGVVTQHPSAQKENSSLCELPFFFFMWIRNTLTQTTFHLLVFSSRCMCFHHHLAGHFQSVRALPLPHLLVKEDLLSLFYRKRNAVQREYLLFVKIPWKSLVNLGNEILLQSLLYCYYHFFFSFFSDDHPVPFLLYAL